VLMIRTSSLAITSGSSIVFFLDLGLLISQIPFRLSPQL
jgi:hypothetical protein